MSLKRAIKNTLEYAAKFGSYVTRKEIEERLISKRQFSKEEIRKILEKSNYEDRKDIWGKEKTNKAISLAKKIEVNFQDILFLGLSGSVASGHPKKNDDIDFLIITKANNLWRTRLRLRWWIFRNQIPHRRYGEKEKKDEFCFNLWLDENYLELPTNKQNLKNSVDLVLLKPLINKNHMYQKFLLANGWAKKWVATPYVRLLAYQPVSLSAKTKNKKIDKFVNCLYFWPQYWYMRRKIGSEQVSLYRAFFHRQMVK